jgi:hypothetical protein
MLSLWIYCIYLVQKYAREQERQDKEDLHSEDNSANEMMMTRYSFSSNHVSRMNERGGAVGLIRLGVQIETPKRPLAT